MAAEPKAPPAPPDLRVSTEETKECEVCEHYDAGACKLYPPLKVSGEWTCNSFSPSARPDKDVSKQPRTLAGAALHAKQHFAAIRAQKQQLQ